MNVLNLKATSITSFNLFNDIYHNEEVKTLEYTDKWANNVDYLQRAVDLVKLPMGELAKSVDDEGRAIVFIGTDAGTIAVFQRYPEADVLAINHPGEYEGIIDATNSFNRLREHSLFNILVSIAKKMKNGNTEIEAFAAMSRSLRYLSDENHNPYTTFKNMVDAVRIPLVSGEINIELENSLRPKIVSNSSDLLVGVTYPTHDELVALIKAFNVQIEERDDKRYIKYLNS